MNIKLLTKKNVNYFVLDADLDRVLKHLSKDSQAYPNKMPEAWSKKRLIDEIVREVVSKNIPKKFWKDDKYYDVCTGVIAVVGFLGKHLLHKSIEQQKERLDDRQVYLYTRPPINDYNSLVEVKNATS